MRTIFPKQPGGLERIGRLRRTLRLVQASANGSWLTTAEVELSVMSRQRLDRRRFQTDTATAEAMEARCDWRNEQKT